MAGPRLSVLIPTRGRAGTLGATLRTCVAQELGDCEFVVSDNSEADGVRAVLDHFDDARLRYVRTPKLLAMTDSWEFAVAQARGEYVIVIGDDDGLLLHALREIDRILALTGAVVLRWESVCYTWPDVTTQLAGPTQLHCVANELLIPLTQVDAYHAVQHLDARPMMLDAAHSRISYAQLPMIYASAVHRSLVDQLRARTGRIFRSAYPDVYSAFAFAYLAGSYYSCTAPMGLSGRSPTSNGVADFMLGGQSPVWEEFRRLNAEAGHDPHPSVPDLPLMPARVADAFQHAREALFPADAGLVLDRRSVLLQCLKALGGAEEGERIAAASRMRDAIRDSPLLLAWFDKSWRTAIPDDSRMALRRYGGTYLCLDGAEFGVRDVYDVAVLCERLLGYRADGVNAHVAPEPSPPAGSATVAARAAQPRATSTAQRHVHELDQALLLRLYGCLDDRTVIDVGAERGVFATALLEEGCSRLWAFEPYPPNASALRERFAGDARVQLLEVAVGARDETADLHIAEDPAGREYRSYHSLARFADTDAVRWGEPIPVACRSLGSLVDEGTLPPAVGVLKIDTEGYDLEVVRGLGRLSPEVVTVGYWDTMPAAAGRCPYSLREMATALAARGYTNGLVIKRHDEFQVLEIGGFMTRPGDWGRAIFVHDRVWPKVASLLHEAVAEAQVRLVDTAIELGTQARRRLEVIQELRANRELHSRPHRWLRPRLGYLRHYPPRPMEIPAHYLAEPPVEAGPQISIVTPTFNAERFLEATLKSVLAQGYSPLEYLVKDGASSDGTLTLLERYQAKLAAVHVERDTGQTDGLNQGFRLVSGEIMAYLNADDLLLPGALRYVARYFLAHPDVDVVYGHRVLIDEHDQEIGRWVLPPHDSGVLSWADYVPQETLFWRRRIWERAGGRLDDSLHFAMDWELLLRFRASRARWTRLPRFLGAFRVHGDQKTSARLADVGAQEMSRLRARVHGRSVTEAEVRRGVRGYLLRHMAYQKLYRAGVLRY
jgi:FkbM family methyltransferase